MKVTITPEFKEAYDNLFNQLQAIVGEDAGIPKIDSLATYFNALKYLQEKDTPPSWKFYRLPLEEPTFDVDMDKRTISVPTLFQNAGLGVKGDTNAEIVIFRVPRWYDAMDLGVQECFVQWSNPNNRKNKMGNSPVVLKDEVDNELLLGWVITADMTEQSGNLEFALRFFTRGGNVDTPTITYSVSTQKASCAIKNTLDLDVLATQIDSSLENLILTRPLYSGTINSMDGAAPVINQNIVAGEYDLKKDYSDFADYQEEAPNGIYKFVIQASSPDGGTVKYRWYKGREQQTDLLTGEMANGPEFVASIAGTYYAQIGNEKAGRGTRWVNSNTAVIPAATEITYAPDYTFHKMAYSAPADSANHVDLVFSVAGANGDVKYSWTVDGAATTQGVSADGRTYTPPVDLEGKVKCTAVNHKNNTTSNILETKNECIVRALPKAPTAVEVQWLAADKALEVTPTFPSPSSLHGPDTKGEGGEWNFIWTRTFVNGATGAQTSQTVSESEGGLKPKWTPRLTAATTAVPNVYKFYCDVSHTVFKGTDLAKTGPSMTSNVVTLEVDSAGNVTVK